MPESLTVNDALKFFLEHRGNKFQNWSEDGIVQAILSAIENRLFAWQANDKGQLCGIALGSCEGTTIHVTAIILKPPAKLSDFIRLFKKLYPEHKLTGRRNGKLVDYRRIYGRRSIT